MSLRTLPRHRRRAILAIALSSVVLASGCSGSSDASKGSSNAVGASDRTTTTTAGTGAGSAPAEEFTGDDFYAVPDPLPEGPHGTLVRYQRLDDSLVGGAVTYRIMYLSESVQGEPITVTGLASVPTADAAEGGRPTITIAHGTTGIADQCAPSVKGQNGELSLVGNAVGDEFLIAATDYEGLGSPGRHPYLVGESEGRSTIDAALAAGELPDADPGDQLGIAGYSQGGHGAVWASQVAADWAPDLKVVGTFAGAPASEVGVVLAAAPRLPQAGFAYMVIAGIAEAYPDADPATFLTPKGVELLRSVDEGCTSDIFEAVGGTPVDQLVLPNGAGSDPWKDLGFAQDAGQEKTNDAPTLIIQSTGDQTIPLFFSEHLAQRMCANGQVVDRQLLDAGGHTQAAVPAYAQAMTWLQERFRDDAPTVDGTCATSEATTATD